MPTEEMAKVINLRCGIRKGDRGITHIILDNNLSFGVHSDIAEWLEVTIGTDVKIVSGRYGQHYFVGKQLLR